jgi:preprotein translocase subunit SecF
VTSNQRTIMAAGSLLLILVGVTFRFGWEWAAIVAGIVGVTLAFLLALGAVR